LRTIPQAAVELGLSSQTLHRWRRDGKLTAERNELGHWLIDLDRIDRDLVATSKTMSEWRYPPGATTIDRVPRVVRRPPADESENAFLREQLARALEMIDRLSGGKPPA
jgi:hypothetical protein